MNIVSYLVRESWKLVLFAVVAGVASGLAGASLAKVISDAILGEGRASHAWLFFGLCLAYLAAKSISELSLMHLVQSAILRLRVELSRKLLATPLKKQQAIGKAELMAIMTNDISAFVQAFQALPAALGNGVILLTCFAYMAWLSWPLFLLFAGIITASLFGYLRAERYPLRQMVKLRAKLDNLYVHFTGLIEGSKELQLNADRGRVFVDDVIAPDARDFRRFFLGTMTTYTWISNVGLVLFYAIIGVLLFVIPALLPQRANVLTTFTLILLFLVRPISDLVFCLPVLRQANVSLDKIRQLEDALATPTEAAAGPDPFASASPLQLELRGVCHHYPGLTEDAPFMLGPMDLTVRQGEILFIAGGNGSGKTTLAMILLGFYEPESGAIRLNGVPVTAENLDAYRRYFSAVYADFHLFEQLLGTDREAVEQRATHYIRKLEMAHKVTVDNGKFSTVNLSTGQRKRLALVSAYLEDRQICVFDEWASDQDPAFKRVFYTELLPDLAQRGKTVVVITHDDAYFHCADRVIRLEDGHLRPAAPHAAADTGAVEPRVVAETV
ncbi:cyclic peptide export ABC transporter [Tahibacter soli]|jgi:putative ATP-binding cassette transporter|uniref:Cyclic peptide export ABC transporter n=1 Tax=Tahibacter soli TaxID=2983605 RepID=A0A9X3YRI8_9GAMM|nr:cyclic peptide export ABC transporter [Tahibacter soli]MDC8016190.1 cyclic peptide export ABC transporter [Tahibacter soli]